MEKYDLIIIGAGPAGLTAGLYAGRYRLNTLILEKLYPGGRILATETIDNFPGFVGGISTQELMGNLQQQVKDLSVPIVLEEVRELDCNSKKVITENKTYETKAVIVATGTLPRKIGLPKEEELTGKGVSYCATCDAPIFRDKKVAVVGGGNAAVEEALYLTRFASQVYLIHRRNELRASAILQEKIKQNSKIKLVLESTVSRLDGSKHLQSITVKNKNSAEEQVIACEGIFVYVGSRPDTAFIKGSPEKDEQGFLVTDQEMKTSLEGIFACGDCRKKSLYQVINACGEGAVAADSAQRYLLNR